MASETVRGVFPIEIGGGQLVTFRCYDAYLTDQRLIANYRQGRTWTRWYGGIVTWGYRLFDFLVTGPLTRRPALKDTSSPEVILGADKHNFAWDYQKDIRSLEFARRRGSWGQYLVNATFTSRPQCMICYDPKHGRELAKLLQEVIPDKVTVKSLP